MDLGDLLLFGIGLSAVAFGAVSVLLWRSLARLRDEAAGAAGRSGSWSAPF